MLCILVCGQNIFSVDVCCYRAAKKHTFSDPAIKRIDVKAPIVMGPN